MDDAPLRVVRRAIEGDADALEALWRDHRAWVASVVLASLPREAELDDALQEVALAMVRSIATLQEPEAFSAWLRELARRTTQAGGRRASARRRRDSNLQVQRASEHKDHEPLTELRAMVQDLPEDYREVLLLRGQGLAIRAIGEIVGAPERTIETRLRRARRMLRESVGEPVQPDEVVR